MKRSQQTVFIILLASTVLMCGVILGILMFRPAAVPQLRTGAPGKNGADAVVDYDKITDYIDSKLSGVQSGTNGSNGKDGTVDYDSINNYIDQKVASLPIPKRGFKGDTGTAGTNGSSCTTSQIETGAAIVCTDGTSSVVSNGVNGQDGLTPQLRCNQTKNQWEIRYSDDESWGLLNNKVTKCSTVVL